MANYQFRGVGNFSHNYNYDNGISYITTEWVIPEGGHIDPFEWGGSFGATHNVGQAFKNPYGRGHFFLTENGGTRNIWGEVVSWDEVTARKCIEFMSANQFPVILYEREVEYV